MRYDASLLQHPSRWKRAPFPHAVIDGLWDSEALANITNEFPEADDPCWKTYADPEEVGKKALDDPAHWGLFTTEYFRTASSVEFMEDLGVLTGIGGLWNDAAGGGLHETAEDGKLEMHIDFNYHPQNDWPRRLNMLVFLNRLWACEWGGCLYLGRDRDVRITPLFNRTVIFECSYTSWHGHPEPIKGAHQRRSLATYFYTEPGSVDLGSAHTTIYRRD
jgi:hypothetical protein